MRKIAGAFRTTPITALEAELAIPLVNIRLNQHQRKYTLRTTAMENNHPIRQLLSDTFPGTENPEKEINNRHTQWNQQETIYANRLDRITGTLKKWIQSLDDIEGVTTCTTAPWKQTTVTTKISNKTKEQATKHYQQYYNPDHMDSHSLYYYAAGSTKGGKLGVGVVGYGERRMIDQRRYHLRKTMEAIDAELIAITKATKIANQHITDNTRKIWIFSDCKQAINRIKTQNNKPGQPWCLEVKNNIHRIKSRGVEVEIHWVPGHQDIPENEKADQLAKEATEGTTRDPMTVVSRNYLRNHVRKEPKTE